MKPQELITRAEALSEKATPGPWQVATPEDEAEALAICVGDDTSRLIVFEMQSDSPEEQEHDAAFIATARALVPTLAARLRDALTVIEAARDVWDEDSAYGAFVGTNLGKLGAALAVFDAGPAATEEAKK